MQPRFRCGVLRARISAELLRLLILAVACSGCGDSSMLYVTLTQWPAGATQVRVSTTAIRGGQTYTDVPGPLSRVIVPLPADVSGQISVSAMALDGDGCAVASAAQDVEAPKGLRRYRELTLALAQLASALCPVRVTIDAGPLQLTAQPAALSLDGNSGSTTQAMLAEGSSLKLHAQATGEGFIEWSQCAVGADCTLSVRRGLQIHVARRDFSCSSDRWCWRYPLPEGGFLSAIGGVDSQDIWAVGNHGTILHWDGKFWSKRASGTTRSLKSVAGADTKNVWAVGDDGIILKWDGLSSKNFAKAVPPAS